MIMRLSIFCCVTSLLYAEELDFQEVTDRDPVAFGFEEYVSTKYMGYKKYTASETFESLGGDSYALQGVTDLTYNAVSGQYMAIADDGLFSFEIEVDCGNGVRMTSESVTDKPGNHDWDGMVAVESADDPQKQLLMFIGQEGITWWDQATNLYHRQTVDNLDGQIPDIIASEVFDDSSDVGFGSIASAKAKKGHYVVYLTDKSLAADRVGRASGRCGDGKCYRIVVNRVGAERKKLIPLHQVYYESSTIEGVSDIMIFERKSKDDALIGIVLEKNRSMYLVVLDAPNPIKRKLDIDVSSCSSLSPSICPQIRKFKKAFLHSFSSKRFGFEFSTMNLVFRDQSGSLLDGQDNLLLVATNNNNADNLDNDGDDDGTSSKPTYFLYFKMDFLEMSTPPSLARVPTINELERGDFLVRGRADHGHGPLPPWWIPYSFDYYFYGEGPEGYDFYDYNNNGNGYGWAGEGEYEYIPQDFENFGTTEDAIESIDDTDAGD